MDSRVLIRYQLVAMVLFPIALSVGCSRSDEGVAAGPSSSPTAEPLKQEKRLAPPTFSPLTESEAKASHRKMIDALAEVAEDSKKTNEYFNSEALIEESRKELASAVATGNIVAELEASKTLGLYYLNHGEAAEAAKNFVRACDLIPVVEENRLAMIPKSSKEKLYLRAAIAYLRLAEDENCVHCTDGTACILPFAKEAEHQKRTGSENAMKYFRRVLEVNPRNATAVWLMTIAAMSLGEYPESIPEEYRIAEQRFASTVDFPRFRNISHDLGIDTLSHAGGVIADDFDGDHLLDILVSNWHPSGQIQLFRNNGDGSFSNVTEQSNLNGITGGLNTVHADYDNDGDIDVYVLRGAWLPPDIGSYPNSLLQNDGTGRFTDVTFAVGLGEEHHPTQTAAWADYDNDGDVDLFVGNEDAECQLYRNDGGRFIDVADQSGVGDSRGVAKAVAWGDFDGDDYADLYVSNLHQENRLYHNNQDGTFSDVTSTAGVASPKHSFAAWFWDYNNDGKLDLYVGSYDVGVQYVGMDYLGVGNHTESDCLYENLGDGRFRDVAAERGLVSVTQPMGCNFGDLDNDGFLDFYLGTGYPGYDALMPNVMYRNRGGEGFDDVTFAGGFGHLQKGHGVAFADFDHDGDQDVFTELGGAYSGDAFHDALFENPGFDNNWIKIRLLGASSNRSAIGASIKLTYREAGKPRSSYRWVTAGSSFGGNPFRQEIGIGKATEIDELQIHWPASGITQTFNSLDCNQFLLITEGVDEYQVVPVNQVAFDVPKL